VYLVLELVHGQNLREVLAAHGGRPPVATVVRWIRQAAEGVAEAHRLGVVHRDLKPENLLVTSEDVIKVIDFGIAKLHGWGVKTSHEQKVGTAMYMSPEHIQGKTPDGRMDVYALGAILFEALAGRHPVVTEPATVFQICALQLNVRPPPLAELVPGLPPRLCALVDRALEKDPERRVPSMRAFSDGLHEALLELGEDRRAQLRSLVELQGAPTAPIPTGPVPSGTPLPAVTRPPLHLVRTEPLPSSSIAVAPTVPVMAAPPAAKPEPIALPASAAPSRGAVIAVIVAAIALGVAGGVWIGFRLF
jgi:serine/threonine-protein kinase